MNLKDILNILAMIVNTIITIISFKNYKKSQEKIYIATMAISSIAILLSAKNILDNNILPEKDEEDFDTV